MGLGGSKAADSQPDAVYWAAYFGRTMELRQMLDSGADVNQRESEYRRTPLIATAFKDRWEAALLLLERGALVEEREESLGCSALMIAAQYNALGVAQVLLEAGADPNAGNDQHGQTALMWCCQYDHAQMASQLIGSGASVSQQRRDTVTPLMIAAKNNAYCVAALLMDNGADPNLVGTGRFTALMICAMVDSLEVAQLLLRHGADKAAVNKDGKTALVLCSENGSYRVAQLLLDTGADPDIVCQDNRHTAASVATIRGHLDLLRLLVEHGANFRHRCADGRGLAELAAASGSQPMIQYIRRLISETHQISNAAELHWATAETEQQQQQQQLAQKVQKEEVFERRSYAAHFERPTADWAGLLEGTATGGDTEADDDQRLASLAEASEETVTPVHVRPLGPDTIVPFEKQVLDDQRRSERGASASGSAKVPQDAVMTWQQLADTDADAERDLEPVPTEEAITATHVRPLGPDTIVPFEKQLLDDQREEVEAMILTEEETVTKTTAMMHATARKQEVAEAKDEVTEDLVAPKVVKPVGPDTVVPFEKQLLDDQKRAYADAVEETVTKTTTVMEAAARKQVESEAEVEIAEDTVTPRVVRPVGPDTIVPFEKQLLDDQKRAETGVVEETVTKTTVIEAAARKQVETEMAEVEIDEDTVAPKVVRPVGPDTIVPFEKQLLDDQKRAETGVVEETATKTTTVMEAAARKQAETEAAEVEITEDLVAPKVVTPVGPDTIVPFEKQLLDDQKREDSLANMVAEADTVTVKTVAEVKSLEGANMDAVVEEKAVRQTAQVSIADQTEDSLLAADLAADDALRAWESLAGLGSDQAAADPVEKDEAEAKAETEAEVSEEPLTADNVRPLGPDTVVSFEQQQLDDQKRLQEESESSKDTRGVDSVDDAVTATHVRPLGPDTAVSFEQQQLDDQKRADQAALEADGGAAAADAEDVAASVSVSESSSTTASSSSVTTAATGSATTTTTRSTTVTKTQKQQQQKKKFPNKKYVVTKKFITTETTGNQVKKRENIVKISVACGDVSESVCQTAGPPQTVKWKSSRETESQFFK